MAIYVNGALDVSAVGRTNTAKTADVLIGADGMGNYFDGLIDDLAIYCEALSANQITALATDSILPNGRLPAPALARS